MFFFILKLKSAISLLLLCISLLVCGQTEDDSIRQVVLKNNVTDSLYVFGKWNKTGDTETRLMLLGTIKSDSGNYKIMTSCWLWGLSHRATNRILIFSEENVYLGNYYLTMTYDLPEKIENNELVFLHSESDDCDKTVITRLSFDAGIPEEFFLMCKDSSGDIYSFDKE